MRTNNMTVGAAGFVCLLSSSLAAQSWILPAGHGGEGRGAAHVPLHRRSHGHGHRPARSSSVNASRATTRAGFRVAMRSGRDVTVAESNGPAEISGPARSVSSWRASATGPAQRAWTTTMKPDFFKGFPPTAVFERNLVWDTGMIEMFGQDQFEHLKLNMPYRLLSAQDVNMPGIGTFQNRDVQLTWIGRSHRNGRIAR